MKKLEICHRIHGDLGIHHIHGNWGCLRCLSLRQTRVYVSDTEVEARRAKKQQKKAA